MMYCSFTPLCWAVIASFSYAMSTSPLPPAKVCSDSRALLSWTETWPKRARRYATAAVGDFPCRNWAPYAAITFHRAPPEVKGLGVITSTPGLNVFGIPWAHGQNDDRVGDHPTESVLVPVLGDKTSFDQAGDVGLEGEGD